MIDPFFKQDEKLINKINTWIVTKYFSKTYYCLLRSSKIIKFVIDIG